MPNSPAVPVSPTVLSFAGPATAEHHPGCSCGKMLHPRGSLWELGTRPQVPICQGLLSPLQSQAGLCTELTQPEGVPGRGQGPARVPLMGQ